MAERVKSHEEDPLMSLTQVAEFVGKTRTTINRWVQDGLFGEPVVMNGIPYIRESVLMAFLGALLESKQPREDQTD